MDIDSIVLPRQARNVAFLLTSAREKFGERATYGEASKFSFHLGIPPEERKALVQRLLAEHEPDDPLDWSSFNRSHWITQQESDDASIRLLTALHEDQFEMREALAQDVAPSKLLRLYAEDEGRPMLVTLRQTLNGMSAAESKLLRRDLHAFSYELLQERMKNTGYFPQRLATQSWLRINMPEIDPELSKSLVAILAYVFTWQRYRTSWSLGDQVNYVHLTSAFLDAWQRLASPASR